jgi:hypothetical protein
MRDLFNSLFPCFLLLADYLMHKGKSFVHATRYVCFYFHACDSVIVGAAKQSPRRFLRGLCCFPTVYFLLVFRGRERRGEFRAGGADYFLKNPYNH